MKPFRVVCIKEDGFWYEPFPKVGDIETVINTKEHNGKLYYRLKGYDYSIDGDKKIVAFAALCFREVDNAFGEWVEETIMKEAELETVLNNN